MASTTEGKGESLDGAALAALRVGHLQMVQGIIGRMSGNSAALKGFCITVTGAVVALKVGELGVRVWWLVIVVGLFALCDAGYLKMERDFRDFYALVAVRPLAEATDMHIGRPRANASGYVTALASWSVGAFYVVVALGVLLMGAFANQ